MKQQFLNPHVLPIRDETEQNLIRRPFEPGIQVTTMPPTLKNGVCCIDAQTQNNTKTPYKM